MPQKGATVADPQVAAVDELLRARGHVEQRADGLPTVPHHGFASAVGATQPVPQPLRQTSLDVGGDQPAQRLGVAASHGRGECSTVGQEVRLGGKASLQDSIGVAATGIRPSEGRRDAGC